ncbi:phosphoribosyltransferase family protein [Nocardia terpenica]|uniref:Phosphoribosyltransferase domain-containing protein n=2 Tax=Nocardia terpenica TaxID=455432 RepID=A0A164KKV9_9NOCA|nr:phosphoribosyltransferase family protein [Nocardia terpenica]KZM71496.1 hypothetical protein AWN90_01735 [Nocardia terpenica]MBF6155760.1 phosphoribosyltransferase [Nocardia terpenica]NQE90680.1 phosphoribosyltransferase [Nocardia terpenica]
MLFLDRRDAGRRLAGHLMVFRGPDIVVAGLAGGGVAVAAEVAARLRVLLNVLVVHELRQPERQDAVFGAISERDVCVVNEPRPEPASGATELTGIERTARDMLRRRGEQFRTARSATELAGRTVVLVDEGLSSPASARAACRAAYAHGAIRVVFAAPVGARSTVAALAGDADKVVCPHTYDHIDDIDSYYADFAPVGDDEACRILREPVLSAPRRAG